MGNQAEGSFLEELVGWLRQVRFLAPEFASELFQLPCLNAPSSETRKSTNRSSEELDGSFTTVRTFGRFIKDLENSCYFSITNQLQAETAHLFIISDFKTTPVCA